MTTLTGWVNGGGNLIAMRPDKQLAGLLGLTDAGATLPNAYLKVDTSVPPGRRDRRPDDPVPRHRRPLHTQRRHRGRDALLERDDRDGEPGRDAALGRLERRPGGRVHLRPRPLGRLHPPGQPGLGRPGAGRCRAASARTTCSTAQAGDVQPDWIDTSKIAIPQADEQQRLLVNLITQMERDRMPLPRFWYLPRGEKAVVVMSGDDHSPGNAPGGTAEHFDRFKQLSPAGCVVADWECVRSTSYIYPDSVLTNAQAAAYVAEGFEVALHPVVASCPTTSDHRGGARRRLRHAAGALRRRRYTSMPAPVTSRTHCVYWPDWASNAKVEAARGIRMDAQLLPLPRPPGSARSPAS